MWQRYVNKSPKQKSKIDLMVNLSDTFLHSNLVVLVTEESYEANHNHNHHNEHLFVIHQLPILAAKGSDIGNPTTVR